MNKEEFIKSLEYLNINITEDELNKLVIYKDFLIEYNTHTNITAITKSEDIYLKHFYDSLVLNEFIKENLKVLDIGTGAGFPGFVLALFNPQTQFTLLDSNNKKIKFLKELNKKLNLKNITLINERAEDYIKNNRENFDIVTSRAVAPLRVLTEISLPFLKVNGLFIPLKANLTTELVEAKPTIDILKGKIIAKKTYNLPIENSKRTILVIKHIDHTSLTYPRRYDKILKNPLKKPTK